MVTQQLRDYGTLRMESADQSRMVEESLKKLLATTTTTTTATTMATTLANPSDDSSSRLSPTTSPSIDNNNDNNNNKEAWSDWPLVNCELTANRANINEIEEIISPLPPTGPLLIPATTVLAWPSGMATPAKLPPVNNNGNTKSNAFSRSSHQKSTTNSSRSQHTKPI
jgi:hypothetical protein